MFRKKLFSQTDDENIDQDTQNELFKIQNELEDIEQRLDDLPKKMQSVRGGLTSQSGKDLLSTLQDTTVGANVAIIELSRLVSLVMKFEEEEL